MHWAGASANVDWATKSLLQHEAVELFGAVGNGGVGGNCASMSENRVKMAEIMAISGCFWAKHGEIGSKSGN